jgi:hypothetical protein
MFTAKRKKYLFDPLIKAYATIFTIFFLIIVITQGLQKTKKTSLKITNKKSHRAFTTTAEFKQKNKGLHKDIQIEKKMDLMFKIENENRPGLSEKDIENLYEKFFGKKKQQKENSEQSLSLPNLALSNQKANKKNVQKNNKESKKKLKENKKIEKPEPKKKIKKNKKNEAAKELKIDPKKEIKKVELKSQEPKPKKDIRVNEQKKESAASVKQQSIPLIQKEEITISSNLYSKKEIKHKNTESIIESADIDCELDLPEIISKEISNGTIGKESKNVSQFIDRIRKCISRFPGKKNNCIIEFFAQRGKILNLSVYGYKNKNIGKAYEMHIMSFLQRTDIPSELNNQDIKIYI